MLPRLHVKYRHVHWLFFHVATSPCQIWTRSLAGSSMLPRLHVKYRHVHWLFFHVATSPCQISTRSLAGSSMLPRLHVKYGHVHWLVVPCCHVSMSNMDTFIGWFFHVATSPCQIWTCSLAGSSMLPRLHVKNRHFHWLVLPCCHVSMSNMDMFIGWFFHVATSPCQIS